MAEDACDARVLDRVYTTIDARRGADPETSYTAHLLAGGAPRAAQKTAEEAVEVTIAAVAESPERLVSESADLLYHLMVLWATAGVAPGDVWTELSRREGTSGYTEKASRGEG